jgi:hypothetical protein
MKAPINTNLPAINAITTFLLTGPILLLRKTILVLAQVILDIYQHFQ